MNEIEKIAAQQPEKRQSLLSERERSLVFGFVYALILAGLTLLLDMIPVPKEDSTLWLMFAAFYVVVIVLNVLMERFLLKKLNVRRGLFYATAQLLLLVAIIVLIVIGVKNSSDAYYNSRELSYAMAFCFDELALLLYHLGRSVVRSIIASKTEKRNNKKRR